MKYIYSTLIIFLMTVTVSLANPFEVQLVVDNINNQLTVQLRNTTSAQPTTSQTISSINMRLLGSVSNIMSIASGNYTMQMPSTMEPNTQVISMSSTGLLSPENWIQNQWVTVVIYNLDPATYDASSFSVQPDIDMDNSDVQDPIMSVAATGVFNTPLTIEETALPVEFSDFTVTKINGNGKLYWTTQTEINSEGFEVEKSIDGSNFGKIGWVEGKGNSSQAVNYEFTDRDLNDEMNYYRLKQVDFDGRFEYSEIRSLKGDNELSQFSIFPNPSNGEVMNIGGTDDKEFKIEVFSITGAKVFSRNVLSTQMDFSRLENGLYMVTITQGNNSKVINWVKD